MSWRFRTNDNLHILKYYFLLISARLNPTKRKGTSPITFSSPSPSLLLGRSMILKETSGGIRLVGSNKSIQLTLFRFWGGVVATFGLGGHGGSLKRSWIAQPSSSWIRFAKHVKWSGLAAYITCEAIEWIKEPHRQQQVLLSSEGEQPMPDRGENAKLEILDTSWEYVSMPEGQSCSLSQSDCMPVPPGQPINLIVHLLMHHLSHWKWLYTDVTQAAWLFTTSDIRQMYWSKIIWADLNNFLLNYRKLSQLCSNVLPQSGNVVSVGQDQIIIQRGRWDI